MIPTIYPSVIPSTDIITTIAGSSTSGSYSGDNGPATSAELWSPVGVTLDSAGTPYFLVNKGILSLIYLGNVYFGDSGSNRVRKVTVATGIITTIAGSGGIGSYSGDNGQATSAAFNSPTGVSVDVSGTYLFNLLVWFTY